MGDGLRQPLESVATVSSRAAARTAPRAGRRSFTEPRRSVVAGAAVDALAEQVGVAVVARVLLDHVGDDPARRPGLARAFRRLLAEHIQARGLRDHLPRRGALPFEGIER